MGRIEPKEIKCIIFDFADTLYSGLYFNIPPNGCENWREMFDTYIFDSNTIESKAMNGILGTKDIAGIISEHVGLDAESVIKLMEEGCKNLEFNQAVLDFAHKQKNKGTITALVSINMEVFTKTVVPAHRLDSIFDVIVNSFDDKDIRKKALWEIAFDKLPGEISFSNSLLIDDKKENVELFEQLGGYAYQYQNDESFNQWLSFTGFD